MGKGQRLYTKAKTLIPGGNMLLSKRPEMFLPDQWPAYYSRAKGCSVWDLDDAEYIDMSIMGVGANVLGYAHPKVDEAVGNAIKNGNLSTLNAPEEVELAELLLELNPHMDMAKFARGGGEAMSIAVRIARAASKKYKIAVCGYHGWHDWYLAANLRDKSRLNSHLIEGLSTRGVPKNLSGSIFTFEYNNFEEFYKLIKRNPEIGIVKMEVSRNFNPKNNFLEKIRDLTQKKGILLIFDECTSGFRQCFGGLHKIYNIVPDIAIFGKALGNGYAINAIIGKEEYMKYGEQTFISSTFWTERIGFLAGIKTIELMRKIKSWKIIIKNGKYLIKKLKELAKKYHLDIKIGGIESIVFYSFVSKNNLKYKTFISQEMLKKNYLASNITYLTIHHKKKVIDDYIKNLDPIFSKIKLFEEKKDNVLKYLKGPVCHDTFKRLTD